MGKPISVRSSSLSQGVWRFHINGPETMIVSQKPMGNSDPLAALRPAYLRRLAARHEELARAAIDSAQRAFDEGERHRLHRMVHSMGSSAAIYGYAGLSGAARAAERLFDDASTPYAAIHESLARLAAEARAVLEST
jgi:HPt (histidine-containing phosphotransfer) domain-containing protein